MIRVGILTPHVAVGPEVELPAMAPGRLLTRVARISRDAAAVRDEGPATAVGGLRALMRAPVLDAAVATLIRDRVDVIGYASTTSAYVSGFAQETAMVSWLARLANVPVVATCASAVAALGVLGVERVALIGAPWFDHQFNELGEAYFRSQGFGVVSSVSAKLSQDPRQIEPAAVYEWTVRHVSDAAEAVFIGGNGFRAAGAIEPLEAALGRPVLTSNHVLLWRLLAYADEMFQVRGYGQLFAHRP
jgi:maleate isomerase